MRPRIPVAWLVIAAALLGCGGPAVGPTGPEGEERSAPLLPVGVPVPSGSAGAAGATGGAPVLAAGGPASPDINPLLLKLWDGPPSVEAFDAVAVAGGVTRMQAARGATCPELAVSREQVLAWMRARCRERISEQFDEQGRRSGEDRYDCGLQQRDGRELGFAGLHTELGPPALSDTLRMYERSEYATDAAGELLGKALSARRSTGDERMMVRREGQGWVLMGAPGPGGAPPTTRTLSTVRARLGNSALAEAAFLASGAAQPGTCYRKLDFALSEGTDWEIAVVVLGVGVRQSRGADVRVLRLSGLVLPDRAAFETLVDASGQELITRWYGGAGPELWTRCPASVLEAR